MIDGNSSNRPAGAIRWPAFGIGGWLLCALLLGRVVFLLSGDGMINGDGTLYVKAAQEIVASGKLPPARFQSLGFAVLIAPVVALSGSKAVAFDYDTSRHYTGDVIANSMHAVHVFMDLAIVLILLYEARKLMAGRAGPLAAALPLVFIAVQPFTAVMTTHVYPDHACMFFFFVGGWLFHRGLDRSSLPELACGGLFLGLASLARIDMIPVCGALACGGLLLHARKGWPTIVRGAAIAGIAFLLPLAAMTAFQYRSTG